MKKKIVFLLSALCSTAPIAFATSSTNCLFENSTTHEDNRYPNLASRFPEKFSHIDFKLLQAMKTLYKDLSSDQAAAQDLVHNPLLESIVKTWQGVFALNGESKTEFLEAEINDHLENNVLTLDWVSLLPMRFAAAISGIPTQEELNIYNWAFYNPDTQHANFFDQRIYTSHEAFKKLVIQENLPSRICFRPKDISGSVVYPLIGVAQLKLHEMVLMNLDHIFPIAVPTTSYTSEVHGIKKPTAFGFAIHDDLHIRDAHNQFLQKLNTVPGLLIDDTKASHILRQKHDLITHVLKFVFHKTLENADMDLSDQKVRQVVLSLFFGNHENGSWPNTMYRAETLEDIIDAFVTFTTTQRERLSPIVIQENEQDASNDLLHTSPIDGSTALSETDIETIFLKKGLMEIFKNPERIESILQDLKKGKKTQYFLSDHNLIKHFIEIRFEDNNNFFQINHTYFTLQYRLSDSKGMKGLLSYAGIKIPLMATESLAGLESAAASRQALTYLNTIAGHATDLMINFGHHAKTLLQTSEVDHLRKLNHSITWQGIDEHKIPILRPFLLIDPNALENIKILLSTKDLSFEKLSALSVTLQHAYDFFFPPTMNSASQKLMLNALISLEPDQLVALGKYAHLIFSKEMPISEKQSLIKAFGIFSLDQREAIFRNADFYLPNNMIFQQKVTMLENIANLSSSQIERFTSHHLTFKRTQALALDVINAFIGMSNEQIDMVITHLPTFLLPNGLHYHNVASLKELSTSQIEAIALNSHIFMNEKIEPFLISSVISQAKDLTPETIHNAAKLIEDKVISQNKTLTFNLIFTAMTNPETLDFFITHGS